MISLAVEAPGSGSGFVISGAGEIVTNAHVVTTGTGARIKRASQVYVKFADGNQVPAKIVGFDPNADVALLRINPAGLTLRPLPLGSTANLKVGSPVAAIGSPFGEEQSLSVGVVSATQRSIDSLTGFKIEGAIQTDAAINHGNSGGPLLDASGRVLGINSQIEIEQRRRARASASRCRSTSCAARSRSCGAAARSTTRTSASRRSRSTRSSRRASTSASTHGAYLDDVARRRPGGEGRPAAARPATTSRSRARASARAATSSRRWAPTPIARAADVSLALTRYEPGQTVRITVVAGRRASASSP